MRRMAWRPPCVRRTSWRCRSTRTICPGLALNSSPCAVMRVSVTVGASVRYVDAAASAMEAVKEIEKKLGPLV